MVGAVPRVGGAGHVSRLPRALTNRLPRAVSVAHHGGAVPLPAWRRGSHGCTAVVSRCSQGDGSRAVFSARWSPPPARPIGRRLTTTGRDEKACTTRELGRTRVGTARGRGGRLPVVGSCRGRKARQTLEHGPTTPRTRELLSASAAQSHAAGCGAAQTNTQAACKNSPFQPLQVNNYELVT